MLLLVLHVIVLVVLIVVNMLACVPTTLQPLMSTKLVEFCYQFEIWATFRCYVMVKGGDWGYRSNPYSSYIYVIYIYIYIKCLSLYAVDVHMDVSPPPYGRRSAHERACEILLQIWASLSWYVMVKWGDWGCWPNPYSSHINVIYIKGVWQPLYAVDVHMDVSPPSYGRSCRPSLWNFATNLGKSQLMWWWNEVIEAVDPTHIHLTSMLYIYKVFVNLYMLWMCMWMCPHHLMFAHADKAC